MKKVLLSISLVFALFSAKSQNFIQFSFCFNTLAPTYMDSVPLAATLYATTGYSGIKYTEISGPNTAVFETPVNSFQNTFWEKSTQWVKGLIPGTYVFEATGTSLTGQTQSFTDTVAILALPAAPTITGLTVLFFGVPIPIPAGQGTKYTLSNGTTSTY